MSDDRFDPRFDPAFQRGYDGPPVASVRKAAARPEPSSPLPPAGPVETVERARLTERPELLDQDDDPRGMNPFLIALGAISLVLVGGGLYLVSRVRDLYADTGPSSSFDFVTLQVLMQAAPVVIGLGLATAVGILFIFAVRWGKGSR